jgi:isoquinoline 1-oxidoreductase beta subunit
MLDDRPSVSHPASSPTEESPDLSRRRLFGLTGAAALVVGFCIPLRQASEAAESAAFAPNAFIRIDGQGDVTLVMPQVEMGQGTYTSISMILAEELDADWGRVKVEHAPPDEKHYANALLGMQATGNSNSIRAFWKPLRQAGAAARAVLVQAAAIQMGVPAAELRTQDSQVIHDTSGRKVAYADLVGRAAALKPPTDPPLKDPAAFRLIGRPLKRLDTPDKTNGAAKYGIDAMPPGLKFATLAASPVLGGTVAHVEDSAAKALPGVRQIVVLDDLVAVVGITCGPQNAGWRRWSSPGATAPTRRCRPGRSGRSCAPPAPATALWPRKSATWRKGWAMRAASSPPPSRCHRWRTPAWSR